MSIKNELKEYYSESGNFKSGAICVYLPDRYI